MNRSPVRVGSRGPLFAAILGTTVAGVGCRLTTNPFADEFAHQAPVLTPSARGAWAVETVRSETQRGFSTMGVAAVDGTVTHGPLYFEAPYEETGGEDGHFAWTGEDFLQLFHWRARFLLNVALFPISAAVTPPWTVMGSDGRTGLRKSWIEERAFDAEPWVEANDNDSILWQQSW